MRAIPFGGRRNPPPKGDPHDVPPPAYLAAPAVLHHHRGARRVDARRPGDPASAAVTTTDLTGALTAEDLANQLAGDGVTVTNATFTGDERAGGSFTGGNGIVGLTSGVVLSSGDIADVVGPNDAANTTTEFGTAGDADLDALSGASTSDAAVLAFDFEASTDQVQFSYVFSSEEYNEFVNQGFNDAFGFFVNGENCALVGTLPNRCRSTRST